MGPLAALAVIALYRGAMRQPTVSQSFLLSPTGITIPVGLNAEMKWATIEQVSLANIKLYRLFGFGQYQFTFRLAFTDLQGTPGRVRRINTTVGEKQIIELSQAILSTVSDEKISPEAKTLMEALVESGAYAASRESSEDLATALRPVLENQVSDILTHLGQLKGDGKLDEQTTAIYERLSSVGGYLS